MSLVLMLSLACGPSDEDVARAAEKSISKLTALALANMSCSVAEAFGSRGPSAGIMETFTDRMEGLTDALQNEGEASNREKMQVIDDMNDLHRDWEQELEESSCEVPDS